MARSSDKGFTLVELMIVVAIIGVLAVVAGTAYRKYMDSARTSEVMAVLGEIRAKEEAYRAEFSTYTGWSSNELTSATFPTVDGSCKEPCSKDWTISTPAQWTALGISPGKRQLQCGYLALSGAAGAAVPGTLGKNLLGTTPTVPWWYAVAICDNDGSTALNASFVTASNTTVVSAQNEHQ